MLGSINISSIECLWPELLWHNINFPLFLIKGRSSLLTLSANIYLNFKFGLLNKFQKLSKSSDLIFRAVNQYLPWSNTGRQSTKSIDESICALALDFIFNVTIRCPTGSRSTRRSIAKKEESMFSTPVDWPNSHYEDSSSAHQTEKHGLTVLLKVLHVVNIY